MAITRTGAPLSCSGVTVDFGAFRAVDGVTATFEPGRVHAVVGQNGAGKTTLARVMAGLIRPTDGTVEIGAEPLPGGNVAEARRHGVELVHQHFALPPDFTVAQCFELFGTDRRRLAPFTAKRLRSRAGELLAAAGAEVDPGAVIGRLPVETLQAVEIARALASDPRVLILDEPTAVLPPPAMRGLFDRVRALAGAGMCVIIVLHKLREVFAVADTATALRAGRLVLAPTPIGDLTTADVARAIVGDAVTREVSTVEPPPGPAPVVLRATSASARSTGHDAAATDVTFDLHGGEILGVAGVEGNGQRSLVEGVIGVAAVAGGTVSIDGADVTRAPVDARRRRGLRVIPFERNVEGVSLSSALWENHAVAGHGFIVDPKTLREHCRAALQRWNVSFRTVDQPSGSLSGGNVQKTILAREITGDVRVLVAAHPTRGLDIAAAGDVRAALVAAADGGAGVLLISADLEEMFQVCHRLLVMQGGRVVAEFTRPFDLGLVGAAMVAGGDT